MTKISFKGLVAGVKSATKKHAPGILTGFGIAGMITTTVLAVKATPKALELIKEAEEAKEEPDSKLTAIETVKTTWKCYIPAAVTCAASVTCLIGASSVSARRNAALATAYELSKTALTEYKDKVVEVIGEEKEKEVREKVSEARIQKKPVSEPEIISTGYGDELFFDPLSGRYFKSNVGAIDKAAINLNKDMLRSPFGYISLNEFYSALNLENVELGEDLGWNIDNIIEIDYHSKMTENGKPCGVLYFINAPFYNYDKV